VSSGDNVSKTITCTVKLIRLLTNLSFSTYSVSECIHAATAVLGSTNLQLDIYNVWVGGWMSECM